MGTLGMQSPEAQRYYGDPKVKLPEKVTAHARITSCSTCILVCISACALYHPLHEAHIEHAWSRLLSLFSTESTVYLNYILIALYRGILIVAVFFIVSYFSPLYTNLYIMEILVAQSNRAQKYKFAARIKWQALLFMGLYIYIFRGFTGLNSRNEFFTVNKTSTACKKIGPHSMQPLPTSISLPLEVSFALRLLLLVIKS